MGFWIGDRYGYPLLLRYGSYIGLTETRIKIAQAPALLAIMKLANGIRFAPAMNPTTDRSTATKRAMRTTTTN
jgi:hypothetical protein